MNKKNLILLLQRNINLIDIAIDRQLNKILHHQRLQQLEASWRGLRYLVEQTAATDNKKFKVRILDVSWKLLAKDLLRAIEFDQSEMFHKIYTEEFGKPGGEPFGILIGDYYISHKSNQSGTVNDLTILRNFSKIATAAFVPFVTACDASMFGLDNFKGLQLPLDLAPLFQQTEYLEWKNFRKDEEARFIGLVLPKVLMRLPYKRHEKTNKTKDYLWGNAIYPFATTVARAFKQSGWFVDICGVTTDQNHGGLVADLPRITNKYATDICITDKKEKMLSELGFIPLCECNYVNLNAFYSCKSIQQAKIYDRLIANNNAELSTMLNYMLCVSRFAHYIKVLVRDKIGSFTSAADCENYLSKWLLQYTAASEELTPEAKAKYPLREASVTIREQPEKPGYYLSFIHLRPHYQLEQIESKLQLVTELTVGS